MKHTVRSRDGGFADIEPYTRGVAIKVHCTECMGYEHHPRDCTAVNCALHPFRGKSQKAFHGEDK